MIRSLLPVLLTSILFASIQAQEPELETELEATQELPILPPVEEEQEAAEGEDQSELESAEASAAGFDRVLEGATKAPAESAPAAEQPADPAAWSKLLPGSWATAGSPRHFFSFGSKDEFSYAVLGRDGLQAHMVGNWQIDGSELITTVIQSKERVAFIGESYRDQLLLLADGSIQLTAEDGTISVLLSFNGWY